MHHSLYTKIPIAALIMVAGAVSAGQVNGWMERSFIMLVAGLVSLFIVVDRGGALARSRSTEPVPVAVQRISEHPDFQAFIDSSLDPLLIVEHARVTRANRAALNLLGGHIVGVNVRMAIRHAGAVERLEDEEAVHSGQPIRLTGIGQRDQQWDMRIRPLGNGENLVHLADRTSSHATERMRVDFVANASHELLTPLGSVKGFIETLRETDAIEDPDVRSRFLKIMADETDRMQALIRDLMSLSRIEAEKYQPVEQHVDLVQLVADSVATLQSGSDPRGRDIVVHAAPDTPDVAGDERQLSQLVYNIAGNAMKYGRAGTPVLIEVGPSRSGSMVTFSVEDQGEGIAPEHIPRLTERFYRVDSGRSRAVGGTGLGLSLVKHIVDRHRGHLDISSAVGKGTRITVLLPAAPDTEA